MAAASHRDKEGDEGERGRYNGGVMSQPGRISCRTRHTTARTLLCVSLGLGLVLPPSLPVAHAAADSKDAKKKAAARFKEAESLFQKHSYAEAAQAFEEANAIAPHPSVLLNAINAWTLAGQPARAASLSKDLIEDKNIDEKSKEEARAKMVELQGKVGRLNIHGKEISKLSLDGKSIAAGERFVDPGDHLIEAEVGGRPVSRKVSVVAGSSQQVLLDAPAPAATTSTPTASTAPTPTSETPVEPKKGLSPVVVYVGGAITLGLLGATIWSGLDTLKAKDEFDKKANPTESDKEAGIAKQTRTNILIGATAVTGLLTTGIGLFATNWGTDKKKDARLHVGPGSLLIEGTF